MSDQKSRFAVDLDDLERQLRQTAGGQPKVAASDPLAELARIVGQDDPFKAMFNEQRSRPDVPMQAAAANPPPSLTQKPVASAEPFRTAPAASGQRMEPSLEALLREFEGEARPPRAEALQPLSQSMATPDKPAAPAQPGLPPQDMLDEFDRLLQGELRGAIQPEPRPRFDDAPEALPRADASTAGRPRFDDDVSDDLVSRREPSTEPFPRSAMAAPQAAADEGFDETMPAARHGATAPAQPEPFDAVDASDDLRSLEPQQPRKGLVIAGALLGVAALGIGAIIGIRGLSGPVRGSGEPPLIKAEAGPSKVQPQNPGGVEIPNQNKQIYERTPEPKPGETRVVTREEQPMDVQASARAASRVILPGPGGQTDTSVPTALEPAAPSVSAVASGVAASQLPATAAPVLGEPRRVRTIAVRPDGTIAPAPGQPAGPAVAEAPPLRAATPPSATVPARAAVPSVPPTPATPTSVASAPPPRPAVTPPPRPPSTRPGAETPPPAAAPQRTPVAAVPPAAPAATTPPAAAIGGGSFMVQLGAPGSEAEARSLFSSLQRRFAEQLGSENAVVRRADVGNGRTVYRLRVGPYSRETAVQRCEALKAAGGQCFVAGS